MHINVVYSYYKAYYDWAVTTCYCLRKLGIESDIYCPNHETEGKQIENINLHHYPEADCYIILNAREFGLYNIPWSAKKIFWCIEILDYNIENENIQGNIEYTKNMSELCDFTIMSHALSAQSADILGIKYHGVFGMAYDEILTKYKGKIVRDKDICFVGNITERRKNILDIIPYDVDFEQSFSEDLHKKLASFNIMLNIHQYDSLGILELYKIILAISEGILVITEPSKSTFPLNNGEHLIFSSSAAEMTNQCIYYLIDPLGIKQRQHITEVALNHIKVNYRMEDCLYNFILRHLDQNFKKQIVEAEVPEVLL